MQEQNVFFPDCLFKITDISSSTFLYFQELPITFTLHPTVSIFQTGCDPIRFNKLVAESNYPWKNSFNFLFDQWAESQDNLINTFKLIDPLLKKGYARTIWLAYPRNDAALAQTRKLINSTGLNKKELLGTINISMASQELISHILFEKFLEIYGGDIKAETRGETYEETRANHIDYIALLKYCDNLFKQFSIEDLLIDAYFFRFNSLEYYPKILLSNENLIKFLTSLPQEKDKNKTERESYYDKIDIIAWEIFRQLTSKYIDNNDPQKTIGLIIDLRENRSRQIANLKNKCMKLAEQFKGEYDLNNLVKNISKHVEINTEKEIRELLDMDKNQYNDLFNEMFSDEKTWIALGALIVSLIIGGPVITAGSALAGIASIGSKAIKIGTKNDEKIKNSDYSLIYVMNNFT
ncbi:hypothetical protein KXD93_12145 [Mucilaginibacter sp. BJC16-A38]|uniref:hypothetical protein n=1 Tax=Mucilaginibacter phenanthrenivorans TaxID=1234842 RepID=UPI0021575C69|nr:hypothetical protein [Mucilaginibacter phenanthrenivorans]MCR8558401.1 hypothetical protein [Mucilaginibacter phenanthrenivorans]